MGTKLYLPYYPSEGKGLEPAYRQRGFGGENLRRYTTGGFLAEMNFAQIAAENLLKAADDLTNATYWTKTGGITVADNGDGSSEITKTATSGQYIDQILTNWFPPWGAMTSFVVELKAGTTLTSAQVFQWLDDTGLVPTEVELISGPGAISVTGTVTGLSTSAWTKIRISRSAKGWSSYIRTGIYPENSNGSTAGSVHVRLSQVILGNQAKPRPVNQGIDYAMMAWKPHWRLTPDGKGRMAIVDTDGLVTVGEKTDILTEPSTGAALNTPSGPLRLSFSFTWEAGQYVRPRVMRIDSNNDLEIYCTGTSLLVTDHTSGATTGLINESGVFADGVFYRVAIEVSASGIVKAHVDDALIATSTEVATMRYGLGGVVYHTLATNDLRILTEVFPRRSTEIIVAGGRATPLYTDPVVSVSKPDGSGFSTGAVIGPLFSITTYGDGYARCGLSTTAGGQPTRPYVWYITGNALNFRDVTTGPAQIGAYADDVERSWLMLQRSSTHGWHLLDHQSGKQWRRQSVSKDADLATAVFPSICGYSLPLTIQRIAFLDLSSVWGGDFAEETDRKSGSVTWDHGSAGYSYEWSFDYQDGVASYQHSRSTTGFYSYIQVRISGNAPTPDLLISTRTIGVTNNILIESIPMADLSSHVIKLTDDNATCKVYLDGVLKVAFDTSGMPTNLQFPAGSLTGAAGYNSVTVSHPYPALGMATDRVVCPQASDTGAGEVNGHTVIRNVTLPSAGSIQLEQRKIGADEITYDVDSTGLPILRDNAVARITGSAADVSDTDDIQIVLDGADGEIFHDGVSDGSTASIAHLTGTIWEVASVGTGGVADAIEFWPLYETLIRL